MNFSCAGWVVDVIAQRGWLMLRANGSQVTRWRPFGMCPRKGRSTAEAMRCVHVTGHVVLDRLADRDCNPSVSERLRAFCRSAVRVVDLDRGVGQTEPRFQRLSRRGEQGLGVGGAVNNEMAAH